LIPDEESLEFLVEHLKFMIQEQPDKKIEKVSDLTDVLSDFMSTFLVVVDALISSSQKRFALIDKKLSEFEDLLLKASIKGLSELSELSHATEKKHVKEVVQPTPEIVPETIRSPPMPSSGVVAPPPPPPALKKRTIHTSESTEAQQENIIEISDDMEVEDLAAFAFQKREKSPTPTPSSGSPGLGTVSLKMELMQELRKKFGSEKQGQNESK